MFTDPVITSCVFFYKVDGAPVDGWSTHSSMSLASFRKMCAYLTFSFNSGSRSMNHALAPKPKPEVRPPSSQSNTFQTRNPTLPQTSKPIWFNRKQETVRYL